MKTKLTVQQQMNDFYLVVRYNDVNTIMTLFNGIWQDYYFAARNWQKFKSKPKEEKDKTYAKAYSDIEKFNASSFCRKQMISFFRGNKYADLIKNDKRIIMTNHSNLFWHKNNNLIVMSSGNHYNLSYEQLEMIFSNKDNIPKILDIGNYSTRVKRLILKTLKAETKTINNNNHIHKEKTFKNIHPNMEKYYQKLSNEQKLANKELSKQKAKETPKQKTKETKPEQKAKEIEPKQIDIDSLSSDELEDLFKNV